MAVPKKKKTRSKINRKLIQKKKNINKNFFLLKKYQRNKNIYHLNILDKNRI